jgi:hypothetical protein
VLPGSTQKRRRTALLIYNHMNLAVLTGFGAAYRLRRGGDLRSKHLRQHTHENQTPTTHHRAAGKSPRSG